MAGQLIKLGFAAPKGFCSRDLSRTTGKYRLLVLDGRGSHLTAEFNQICRKNDIIPICMPAHSSNYL